MNVQVEDLPDDKPQASQVTETAHETTEHMAIAKRFNLDAPTKQEEQMLKEIWEYAKGLSKIGDSSDIIWQVINLEGIIGAPQIGSSRLEKLYQYAKLRRQERQIQEEIKHVASGSHL